MNWFRAHHGLTNDEKLAMIARETKSRLCEVGWLWVCLMERASQAEDRGSIAGYSVEILAFKAEIKPDKVAQIIDALIHWHMIVDGRLASWEKRQPKRERDDDSSGRVREFRQKRGETQQKASETHVTPCNATKRPEERRLEERREEQQQHPAPIEMPRQSEYPKTDAAVRRSFATADLRIVVQIVQAATQAYLSVDAPKIPPPGDQEIAEAVQQAWQEAKSQTSAALYLRTVPAVIQTWCLHGRHPPDAKTKPLTGLDKIIAQRRLEDQNANR